MGRIKMDVDFEVNKASVTEVKKALQDFQNQIDKVGKNYGFDEQLKKTSETARELNHILNDSWNSKLGQLDLSKLNDSINKTFGSVGKLKKILEDSGSGGAVAFNTFSRAVLNTNLQLSQSSKLLDDMADTMSKTVKWGIASSIFNTITNSVQKAYDYTVKLDTSLNDIRIVTGKSADEMNRFAVQANKVAKDLGRSTKDFTEASLIYYQQGLGNEEAQARAEVTMKAANVTGQTGQEVSEQLTSVWNGYKVSAEETELYVDKLAAVAASTAADLEELSTGMSKVASAANLMGVDVDQLNAQLATIVSVTRQAPESVGVALKTIYARMSDIKSGLDDETTLGNYTEKMAQYGINVLDANNNLRDMGKVIEEIGEKWTSLSREQQVALSQVMAGTRQYNNLLSLFDNWNEYRKALDTSRNSAGELQKQQDIYMESTAAHLKQLSTEAERTYDILFDQDTVNGFADALTSLLDKFNDFLAGLGGGTNAFIYFGSVATNIFKKQIAGGINNVIDKIEKMKQNAASLNLMRDIVNEGKSTEVDQPQYVDNDLARAEELLQVQKYISNEEFNELNELRQQITEYDAILEYLEKIKAGNIDITKEQANINYSEASKAYQNEINTKNKILALTKKINIVEKTDDKKKDIASLQNYIQLLENKAVNQNDINNLKLIENSLDKDGKLSQEQINQLEEIENKNIIQLNQEMIKRLALAKAITVAENGTQEEIQEAYNKYLAIYNTKIGNSKRKGEITDLIQGLSTVTSLLTSISGIVKTLNDDDLSFGEKAEQVISVLLMNLPMLLTNLNSLKNLLPAIAGATNKAAIAMGAEGVTAASGFGTSLMGIIGVAAPYIAAIGAIVAIGYALVKAYNAEANALKEAENNIKKANEAYDELKGNISNYESSYKDIKKLTEGTTEFYEAIVKSNEEAQKLIDNLGLIAGSQYTIDKNGLININEDVLEDSLFKKSQELYRTQLTKDLIQYSSNRKKDENEIRQKTKEFQLGLNEKTAYTGIGITYEQAESMINNLKDDQDTMTYSLQNTNNNLKTIENKMGQFNQEVVTESEKNFGNLSFNITKNIAEVKATIKEKQAIDRERQKSIGAEAIKAYATKEQNEIYSKLPSNIANSINQQLGTKITENYNERISSGLEGKNVTSTFEQMVGLGYLSPFINTLAPGLGSLWSASVRQKQQNYNKTQAVPKETVEDRLDKYLQTINSYLNRASQAGFSSGNGGQYIAQSQFEAISQKSVSEDTLKMMTPEELTYALETSKELRDTVLQTNQSIKDYVNNFMQEQGLLNEQARTQERLKEDLKDYNETLESSTEELDTSTKALKLYGLALENATGEANKYNRASAENIIRAAKFNKVFNEGVETFKDAKEGYEEYVKALKEGKTPSYTAAEATAEIQENLEKLSGLKLSEHFLGDPKNLKDIKALYEGTEEEAESAYDRLLVKMQKDNLTMILQDSAYNMGQTYEDIYNIASGWVDEIASLDPGATLSEEFSNSLIDMINNAHLSTAQLEELFNTLDLEVPPVNTENLVDPEVEYVDVPGTSVTHHYEGEYPTGKVNKETGDMETRHIDYYWTESQAEHKQPYVKFDKGQEFNKNTSGNSPLGRGSARTGGFRRSPSNKDSGKKGGSGGSGGNAKEPDKMDPLEKEKDRYHDVDIQLKQIQTDLDKLDKQKKKLFGQDLINNLNKRLGLLNKQIDRTNDKIKIAQGETQELKDKLSGKGVSFNADGTIANYAAAYASQLNYVNSLIAQYNSMSAEAQEGFKDTVEKAKEDFDNFVDNINKYDTLITDTIPGLEADIQDAIDEKIDLQIEKFDMEIEIRLDLAEAERDWNEFKKKIIDGIEDDDILGNAMARLVDFSSYYKEDNTGIVQALRKQVDNTLAELAQMDRTGQSNIYGDNRTAALDDLKKYYEELMSNLKDVLELQEEIHQSYIDMMDEAQEKFDEQIEAYEMISDLIEHDMEVISLVYGEQSYGQLAKYYDKQQQNFNSQLDFQRQQADFWRQQLDTLEEGSDEWENAREKWKDAVQSMNDLIEESIQNLQDKYLNAINLIFQNLNNKITDNLGLEYIEEEWNLINKNADQYLDTINSLYEVQKLEGKYLDALDQTDSISAQRQLKKIMDEELADLRERDKLTEYDIERANKKYEIALKQIALQEAQQNKSKMRLRRDSQGNYRYEYTADGDQISQLQDELNDMYNSLYNFDKARYQDNLNQMYDVWVEFQEKMAEAAQINDPVARSERELLLQSQYEQLINGLTEQNTTVRENLHESAFDDLSRLYDIDVANFQNMSDEEKDVLMGDLLPYWESGVQHMTDVFAGEDGFLGVCKDAFDQLHDATKDYEDGLDELENTGRIDFESIGEGIDENINRTQQLISDNTELINSYEQELTAIGNVIAQLDDLVNKYNAAKDAAIAATKAAYEYWSEQQRQAAAAASNANGGSGSGNGSSGSSSGSSGKAGGSGSGGDGNLVMGDTATFSGRYYYDSYGTSPVGSKYSGVANGVVVDRITNNPYGIHIHSADGRYPDLGWVKRSQLSGYDTGGYTGEWGSDGRLALLHQKELVLNKEDTANMLNAISIMRNITNMLGSSVLGKLAAATAGGLGTEVGGDVLEQNVHIDAQFPNVKDSREIEEALNNLVNMASMRANRR